MEIKITIEQKELCPYCNERPIKEKTCGGFICQYKRHILQMRTRRKTDQVRSTRIKIQ